MTSRLVGSWCLEGFTTLHGKAIWRYLIVAFDYGRIDMSKTNEAIPICDPTYRQTCRKVVTVGEQHIIHVENGRGEELRQHLTSHGIDAIVSPGAETDFERIEIPATVNAEDVQTILDEWED